MKSNQREMDRNGRSGSFVSDTRDPRFESNHRQFLLTLNCIKKAKINKNSPGMAHFKEAKQSVRYSPFVLCCGTSDAVRRNFAQSKRRPGTFGRNLRGRKLL